MGVGHGRAATHVRHPHGTFKLPDAPGALAWADELTFAERACCCTARPAVAVIIPGAAASPPLLLCGHHFRMHRDALDRRGALVYDRTGHEVGGDLWCAN